METLEIRHLTHNDEVAFLAGLKEWEGEVSTWHSFAWQEGMSHSDHIRILEDESMGVVRSAECRVRSDQWKK